MHIQRLFEIVYLLLYRKKTTARELAERFEVSTRTIYRDIDTLSAAGIPVYTSKGKDGGIFLLEGFVLNRSLLSEEEQKVILASLKGVSSVTDDQDNATLERMRTFFHQQEMDWISIDLSDWSNRSRALFEQLQEAIWMRHAVTFTYSSAYGKTSDRCVYPLQLWFKDRTWYLKAFCKEKDDFRLFKVNRIQNLQMEKEVFPPMQYPPIQEEPLHTYPQSVSITLWVDNCMAYRVYDEYTQEEIEQQSDGSFLLHLTYPEDEWVYGSLLSFGPYAKVLAPQSLVEKLKKRLDMMQERYSEEGMPTMIEKKIFD